MFHRLDAVKSGKLVFSLRRKLSLYVFNKGVKLLDSILLRLLNFFDRSLDLTNVVLEITKSPAQATCLSSD